MPPQYLSRARLISAILLFYSLAACQPPATPASTPTSLPPVQPPLSAPPVVSPQAGADLTAEQAATLNSLEQVANYPLYTMRFSGAYQTAGSLASAAQPPAIAALHAPLQPDGSLSWGCSLFATLDDPGARLYGRNFDWRFSPALLLFTAPPDGYASVSMVDIDYLGYGGDNAQHLTDRPLSERRGLLAAPEVPFDGMNEKGLAVGMAAVPPGDMRPDPQKRTLDQVMIIREMLDHAATVEEAVDLLGRYNIDMGSVPIHYLIASAAGKSALVEFYAGERRVFWNEQPWHLATNFLLAAADGAPAGYCWRYDRLSQRLSQAGGRLAPSEAIRLLSEVSQDNTQWSIVYNMTTGEVNVVMGRDYAQPVHTLHLDQASP
jgi:hypothetical protein